MTTSFAANLVDIRFRYSIFREPVLSNLSWQIENGLNVILGPNGAGKSTLLQILAGILKPQSGVILTGHANVPKPAPSPMGYLPQDVPVIRGLSVTEQVRYHLWLSGMSLRGSKKYVERAITLANLDHLRNRPTHQLSGGERRRLGIACAIVHEPSVVLLDEPTAGLDPLERQSVESIITDELKDRTVLVTTHQMEGVVAGSDYVAILADGRLVEYRPTDWYMRQRFAQTDEPWIGVYRNYFEAPFS